MKGSGRKIKGLFFLCVLAPIPILTALEWPVASGYPAIPFGSFQTGRFATTMAILPANAPVVASAPGDISFQFDGDMLPSGLPCPLGGFVALHHPDGMTSVYGHLERGSLPQYLRSVAVGDLLGRAGASGFSAREHSCSWNNRYNFLASSR